MGEHTPEPWYIVGDSIRRYKEIDLYEYSGNQGMGIAGDKPLATFFKGWYDIDVTGYPHRENLKRAVQCVNALAGIENPEEWVKQIREMAANNGRRRDVVIPELQSENARLREALVELYRCAIFANEEIGLYPANVERTPEVIAHNEMAKRLTNAIIKSGEALKGGNHETR